MQAEPSADRPIADEPPVQLPVAEARQRWRLTAGRSAAAPAATQRETTEAWEAAVLEAGLPVARTADARSRLRLSFGAPLPAGMAADGELIDLVITERWPRWRVREALTPCLPAGWRLVDLEDVWLAGPALAGRVAAADHRVELAADAPDAAALAGAASRLLAAETLVRARIKGDRTVDYDLRPLVLDVQVEDGAQPAVLAIRTRIHPELGTGRPEEVVAALGDLLGRPVPVDGVTRIRLLLVDELD